MNKVIKYNRLTLHHLGSNLINVFEQTLTDCLNINVNLETLPVNIKIINYCTLWRIREYEVCVYYALYNKYISVLIITMYVARYASMAYFSLYAVLRALLSGSVE